jgi:hypothetical protein
LEDAIRGSVTSVVINFALSELLYPIGGAVSARNSTIQLPPSMNLLNDVDRRSSYATLHTPNRLAMRVIRLEYAGKQQGNQASQLVNAYVSVEIDEPTQRFITQHHTAPWGEPTGAKGRVVVWDEGFELWVHSSFSHF